MRHTVPRDAVNERGGDAAGLPSWNLDDLYPGPESDALRIDLDGAERDAKAFAERTTGRLADLSGAELAAAIAEYERIEEVLGRAGSYAQLTFSSDNENPEHGRFYQQITERVTTISTHLLGFSLELNKLDDAVVEAKLADPALARWAPFLRDLRVFRPHQLADEIERVLHEKSVTGAAAWQRLFDETIAGMRVQIGEDRLTVNDALNRLSDKDRARRESAGREIGRAHV